GRWSASSRSTIAATTGAWPAPSSMSRGSAKTARARSFSRRAARSSPAPARRRAPASSRVPTTRRRPASGHHTAADGRLYKRSIGQRQTENGADQRPAQRGEQRSAAHFGEDSAAIGRSGGLLPEHFRQAVGEDSGGVSEVSVGIALS